METNQLTKTLVELGDLTKNIVCQTNKYNSELKEIINVVGRVLDSEKIFGNLPNSDSLAKYNFVSNCYFTKNYMGKLSLTTNTGQIISDLKQSELLKNNDSGLIRLVNEFVQSIITSKNKRVVFKPEKKIFVDLGEIFYIKQCSFSFKWLRVALADENAGVIFQYSDPMRMAYIYLQSIEEFKSTLAQLLSIINKTILHNSEALSSFKNEISPFVLTKFI